LKVEGTRIQLEPVHQQNLFPKWLIEALIFLVVADELKVNIGRLFQGK
jgi:hypothetical protein